MSVLLFGAAIPTDRIAVVILALVTAVLLFRIKKYFARQQPAKIGFAKPGEESVSQKNAQVKREPTFAGGHKPETIARWEIEFFELTRQMSAQIDTKMSALSTLSIDAARICQRMETLLERLEKAVANPAERIPVTPPTRPVPSQLPTSTGNVRDDFPPSSPPASHISAAPLESKQEKKTLFPRLSSLSGLEFSDYEELASIGADLFTETPLESKPLKSGTQSLRSTAVEVSQSDFSLGELLLQERDRDQAARLQSVSKAAPTLQATQIESIFKPIESRPHGTQPTPQIIPRERIG